MSRSTPFSNVDDHERAAAVAAAPFSARLDGVARAELGRLAQEDPAARVRSAALTAFVRSSGRTNVLRVWRVCTADPEPSVRRRAAELAPAVRVPLRPLVALLQDDDWSVAEATAWALGEIAWSPTNRLRAVRRLLPVASGHDDPLVREAAVAALGALGDAEAVPTILAATRDRPAVRRRAVLALAPFDGPEVDAALERALTDPDWQVRQAAEDMRGEEAERADTSALDPNG